MRRCVGTSPAARTSAATSRSGTTSAGDSDTTRQYLARRCSEANRVEQFVFCLCTEGAGQESPGQARVASDALGRVIQLQSHAESVRLMHLQPHAFSVQGVLVSESQGVARFASLPWAFLPCTFGAIKHNRTIPVAEVARLPFRASEVWRLPLREHFHYRSWRPSAMPLSPKGRAAAGQFAIAF